MKKRMIQNKLLILGAVTGMVGGYLYWKYIGCLTGTCAITSNPYRSIIYFGIVGGLLFGFFKKEKQAPEKQ